MNEYLVLGLDGLLYLGTFLLLSLLTAISARLFYRGHQRATFWTAVFCVVILGAGQNLLEPQIRARWPGMDPFAQAGLGAGIVFLVAWPLVLWRYSISWLSAGATALVLVLAMCGLALTRPVISAQVLPPGPRLAEFLDSASSRTRAALEASKKFKTVNESAPGVMATALSALADLSSKDEFEALKRQFRGGVKFYADRKAEWDAMTPEEREANKKAMAEFMAEQGLAADRYSLSALKNAKMEDVQNLVAFMKEIKGSLPPDSPMAVRPPEESMQIILRNISGATFTKEDHEAMAQFSKIFFHEGADAAIARTRTELVTTKVNPAWAGAFLSAMLETKSGLPVSILASDPTVLDKPEASSAAVASSAPVAPAARMVRMITLPTKFGYLRVPQGSKDIDEFTAAADSIPVTGFLAGGDNVRVALGNKSIGVGDVYRVRRGAKVYAFRVEKVVDGLLHLIGLNPDMGGVASR